MENRTLRSVLAGSAVFKDEDQTFNVSAMHRYLVDQKGVSHRPDCSPSIANIWCKHDVVVVHGVSAVLTCMWCTIGRCSQCTGE